MLLIASCVARLCDLLLQILSSLYAGQSRGWDVFKEVYNALNEDGVFIPFWCALNLSDGWGFPWLFLPWKCRRVSCSGIPMRMRPTWLSMTTFLVREEDGSELSWWGAMENATLRSLLTMISADAIACQIALRLFMMANRQKPWRTMALRPKSKSSKHWVTGYYFLLEFSNLSHTYAAPSWDSATKLLHVREPWFKRWQPAVDKGLELRWLWKMELTSTGWLPPLTRQPGLPDYFVAGASAHILTLTGIDNPAFWQF